MEFWNRETSLRHAGAALGRGILLILVLPLITALLFGYPVLPTLAMIGSSLVLESTAAPVGVAFGLTPYFVFFVLMCTETGIFLCLYDILNTIGHSSPRVARLIDRSHAYAERSPTLARYGILGLIPSEIVIGVYLNAPLSWVLGWDERRALLFTLLGYIPILILTVGISVGIFQIAIPWLVHP